MSLAGDGGCSKRIQGLKAVKDKSIIPPGMYCYIGASPPDEKGRRKIHLCPYWRRLEDRDYQYNGWCDYLEQGDLELAEDRTLQQIDPETKEVINECKGSELPFPVGLLWDQCKECGINDDFETDPHQIDEWIRIITQEEYDAIGDPGIDVFT